MKNLVTLILLFLFVSSANAQVYGESGEGIIDKNYESFTIIEPNQETEMEAEAMIIEGEYVTSMIAYTDPEFPSPAMKEQVEHAIKHELISEGFDFMVSGGEMVVSYFILDKATKLTGDFIGEKNKVGEMKVKKGTLLVSVIDKDSGETVWSGFSNGAFANRDALDNHKIIREVSAVLDRMVIDNTKY